METTSEKIRILLVDDHALVREGVRSWLSAAPGMEIVGEAIDGESAITNAKKLQPNVILLDLHMPRMTGFEAITVLRKEVPKAAVLALTVADAHEEIRRMLDLGASGYLRKDASPSELVRAIETLVSGQIYLSPAIAKVLLGTPQRREPEHPKLTAREVEVLKLIAEEFVTKEIAIKLDISPRTVEAHRARLMRKLGVKTFAGLTRYAIASQIASIAPDARAS